MILSAATVSTGASFQTLGTQWAFVGTRCPDNPRASQPVRGNPQKRESPIVAITEPSTDNSRVASMLKWSRTPTATQRNVPLFQFRTKSEIESPQSSNSKLYKGYTWCVWAHPTTPDKIWGSIPIKIWLKAKKEWTFGQNTQQFWKIYETYHNFITGPRIFNVQMLQNWDIFSAENTLKVTGLASVCHVTKKRPNLSAA